MARTIILITNILPLKITSMEASLLHNPLTWDVNVCAFPEIQDDTTSSLMSRRTLQDGCGAHVKTNCPPMLCGQPLATVPYCIRSGPAKDWARHRRNARVCAIASKALWRRSETSLRVSYPKYTDTELKPLSPAWSLCGALHVAEAATSRLPIFDPLEIVEKIGDFNQFFDLHFLDRG